MDTKELCEVCEYFGAGESVAVRKVYWHKALTSPDCRFVRLCKDCYEVYGQDDLCPCPCGVSARTHEVDVEI